MLFNKKCNGIILLFMLLCGLQQPAFAYIDPGTGSMLFSIVVGVSATIFFLVNSLILKIRRLLFSSKKLGEISSPFVIYSEGNQYWCVFKPIIDEFEAREIPLVYYTSAEDDKIFSENYKFVKSEFIGKGNRAYFKLAFLNADICLLTTPQLDVLQLKRSKNVKHYSHILHAITFSCGYHMYALDYYDSVLCDADFQIPLIREIEQKRNLPQKELVVVGSSYMDYYNSIKNLHNTNANNDTKTVLIAPSWGKDNLLHKIGTKLLDKLVNSNFNIVVRPHPQSMIEEKDYITDFMNKYKSCPNIAWNFDSNNINALSNADVLISDFSGVMFDYAFLFSKPFIYFNTNFNFEMTDIIDLDEIPYRYKVAKKIGKELFADNIDDIDIVQIIQELISGDKRDLIEQEKNYAWMHQGEAAKRVVDYLIDKQREIKEKC